MECLKCKHNDFDSSNLLFYDGCQSLVHRKCSNLSATELKMMDFKQRVLRFFCSDCQESLSHVPKLIKEVAYLQSPVEKLLTDGSQSC